MYSMKHWEAIHMTDKDEILKDERAAFNAWSRTRYHNKTINGDELAWAAWRAAISNHLREQLDEDSDLPDECLITMSRRWAKKIIQALRGEETK
jgi:hypothetical protein